MDITDTPNSRQRHDRGRLFEQLLVVAAIEPGDVRKVLGVSPRKLTLFLKGAPVCTHDETIRMFDILCKEAAKAMQDMPEEEKIPLQSQLFIFSRDGDLTIAEPGILPEHLMTISQKAAEPSSETIDAFREAVIKLRNRKNWSQAFLSNRTFRIDRSHIPVSSLKRFELERTDLSSADRAAIAKGLTGNETMESVIRAASMPGTVRRVCKHAMTPQTAFRSKPWVEQLHDGPGNDVEAPGRQS